VLAGLWLVLRPPRAVLRPAVAWSAAACTGSLVLFLPWVLTLATSGMVRQGVGWTRPLASAGLLYFPFALLFGFSLGPDLRELHARPLLQIAAGHPLALLLAAAAMVVLAAGLVSIVHAARRGPGEPPAAVLYLLAPVCGFLGPALFAVASDFPLVPRHLMFLWPLVPLLEASLAAKRKPFRGAVVAILALQAVASYNLLYDPAYAKDDERGAVRFAESGSGARPVILGDAAPLYTTRALGLMKAFTDPKSDAVLGSDATDLWLVDNRPWEDPEGNVLDKTGQAAARLGLVPAGSDSRFHGLVLRHWRRAAAAPGGEP